MENNVQPSFIPKKPLSQLGSKAPRQNISLFSIIATVVFVTVIIIAGAVFGFKSYEENLLTKKKAELEATLASFQPSLIQELTRLDNRLIAATNLLNQHLSITDVFTAIGNATLKNVRFSSFSFSYAPGLQPGLIMDGVAQNFTAIALQAQEFNKPDNLKYIKNPIISNLNLNKDGTVNFSFVATVDPKFLTYSEVSKAQGITVSSVTVPAISTTTTSVASTTTSAPGARSNLKKR